MAITAKKQKDETTLRLVQRFIQTVRASGIILEARKRMYRERPINERKKKLSALHRLKKQQEAERLKRLGRV